MLGTSLVFSVKVAKNLSQLLTRREALKQEKKTNVFSNFFYSTRNLCGLRLLDPWCTSVPNKVFYMYGCDIRNGHIPLNGLTDTGV